MTGYYILVALLAVALLLLTARPGTKLPQKGGSMSPERRAPSPRPPFSFLYSASRMGHLTAMPDSEPKSHIAPFSIALLVVLAGAAFFVWGGEFWAFTERHGMPNEPLPPPPPPPEKLTWSLATSTAPWQARDSAAAFVFEDRMWIMGGLDGNAHVRGHQINYWKAAHFNDIWSSEDGVNWTEESEGADFPPRRSMSVVYFKDKLWMFGGWSPVEGYQRDVWASEDGMNWKKVLAGAPWSAREGQQAEVFNGKIWMMGGVHYDKHQVKNDVWFTEDGLMWQEATSSAPWVGRWDHATAVFQNKLWLTAGMDLKNRTFRDVWNSEDGVNWNLITAEAPWGARQGHTLLPLEGVLWLIGRLDDSENGGANDAWFTEDGVTWRKTDQNPAWTGREDFSALVFKGTMWVMGGMDSSWRWKNDVWRAELPSTQ